MGTSHQIARSIAITLCLVGLPHLAAAQQAATAATDQTPQAPMSLEPVDNGFVIAPDFKYTDIDKSSAKLAGVYGGWVYDRTLLFGLAGYWQTNQTPGRGTGMEYGGAIVRWLVQDKEPVGFSLGALVGAGQDRLPTNVAFTTFAPGPNSTRVATTQTESVLLRDQFFVFEPEADVSFKLGSQVRLAVGVGYRAVGGAYNVSDSRLQGASGSVSLQFFTTPVTRSRHHRP